MLHIVGYIKLLGVGVAGHKDLRFYQLAMDLVTQTYRITKHFPKSELFALTSQMQRAAVSVPSNIAEGSGRGHKNEYLHFLRIAAGSLSELETQFIIAERLEYITPNVNGDVQARIEEIRKTLYGFTKKLRAGAPAVDTPVPEFVE